MSRNTINQFLSEKAFAQALNDLEKNLEQFKSGVQPPTILVSPITTVTGNLYGSFFDNGGNSPQFNATATHINPGNRIVMAIPEIDLFNGSITDINDIFPDGSFFASSSNAAVYIKFKYWLDLAATFDTNGMTARLTTFIDGALYDADNPPWSGNTFTIGVRFRYMQQASA
jgi:hypothetical protein